MESIVKGEVDVRGMVSIRVADTSVRVVGELTVDVDDLLRDESGRFVQSAKKRQTNGVLVKSTTRTLMETRL